MEEEAPESPQAIAQTLAQTEEESPQTPQKPNEAGSTKTYHGSKKKEGSRSVMNSNFEKYLLAMPTKLALYTKKVVLEPSSKIVVLTQYRWHGQRAARAC